MLIVKVRMACRITLVKENRKEGGERRGRGGEEMNLDGGPQEHCCLPCW